MNPLFLLKLPRFFPVTGCLFSRILQAPALFCTPSLILRYASGDTLEPRERIEKVASGFTAG